MTLKAAILGAGFIGQNFIRQCLLNGDELRILDHKVCPTAFERQLTWIKGDFSDDQAVRKVLQHVDLVYHFISSTVPGDITDESSELIQNVVQTLRLLKLCVEAKVKRIVFISSASVYGLQKELPIGEFALPEPISSHGIHKLTIENYLKLYQYQFGLECKILRLSNPYGPGQRITGRQGIIAIAIGKILAGEPIPIRGDGTAIRDFIHIDDVCEVLHRVGSAQIDESILNVGSGSGYSLNQVITMMESVIGRPLSPVYTESRFADIPASVLDITRARNLLGFEPKVSLRQGLEMTFSFHNIHLASQVAV
ncbi:MAG: NAD-dependent epimerase/dehydratase family protein [Betaproteobacteria bacterium]